MRRWMRWIVAAAAVALAVVWIVGEALMPATQQGPPAMPVLATDGEAILRRACYDCHSDQVEWPWYTHLPVASLLVALDVREGREKLNFSAWADMPVEKKRKKWDKAAEEIREAEMPPAQYVWLHRDARLSEADVALLEQAVPNGLNAPAAAGGAGE